MADNYRSSSHYSSHQPTLPLHLCFFLLVLFAFLGFTWYISFDNIFGQLFDVIKLVLVVSPLVLLVVLHLLSFWETSWGSFRFPDQETLHGAGGTPWGVGLLLVLILLLWSYQSDFRERWFPLLT